jgi:CDP-diacylglycerol--glycerol-3-phosphate 3-phosphatidyltransferase
MREFLLPPNLLSIIRLGMLFPIVYYMSLDTPRGNIWCLFWIMAGVATDLLDGHLARRYGMITETGKILDPLVDKITTITIVLCLESWRGLPLWLTVMIVGRDVSIILSAIFIINRAQIICQSNWAGKLTVNVLAMLVIAYVLNWDVAKAPLQIASAVSLLLSLVFYGKNFKIEPKSQSA